MKQRQAYMTGSTKMMKKRALRLDFCDWLSDPPTHRITRIYQERRGLHLSEAKVNTIVPRTSHDLRVSLFPRAQPA